MVPPGTESRGTQGGAERRGGASGPILDKPLVGPSCDWLKQLLPIAEKSKGGLQARRDPEAQVFLLLENPRPTTPWLFPPGSNSFFNSQGWKPETCVEPQATLALGHVIP